MTSPCAWKPYEGLPLSCPRIQRRSTLHLISSPLLASTSRAEWDHDSAIPTPMLRLLLLAAIGTLHGCAMTPPGIPMGELAPEINSTLAQGQAVLTAGDVLSVQFPRLPAWNQDELVVQPDGRVSFLSLDDVQVAGLTLAMLDRKLTEEYTNILAEPELTVRTTELAERTFVVMGEVTEGGSFPLPTGRLSLLEALGVAQGFVRDTAQLDHLLLLRWIPAENQVRAWKIDASVEEWGATESILVQANDVIFVPAKPVVDVNDWIDRYIRRMIPFPYLLAPGAF